MNITRKVGEWTDISEDFLERNYVEVYMTLLLLFSSAVIWVIFPMRHAAGFQTTIILSATNALMVWFTLVSATLLTFPLKYEGQEAEEVGRLITPGSLTAFIFGINLVLVSVSVIFLRNLIVAIASDSVDMAIMWKGIIGMSILGTLGTVLMHKYRLERIASEKVVKKSSEKHSSPPKKNESKVVKIFVQ